MTDIEKEVAAFKPEMVEDLAFTIFFANDDGSMDLNNDQVTLARDAYAMLGIEPRDRTTSLAPEVLAAVQAAVQAQTRQ